jgi:hypothetical protein
MKNLTPPVREGIRLLTKKWFVWALLFAGHYCLAQTVSPIIVEYKAKAEGKIALTNNTLAQMAVVVEPRSFTITPDGNGIYTKLDPAIHVQLSSTSFRIDPGQTYYVFYKATSDKLPAWFTIYSAFSAVKRGPGLDVRILLPHTVYIYPKKPQTKGDIIKVTNVLYSPKSGKILCDLQNDSPDLDRVQEVRIMDGDSKASVTAPGFPVLPGSKRHLEIDWKEPTPPRQAVFQTEHSKLEWWVTRGIE